MEDKFAKLFEESKDEVSFKEPTGDISIKWVLKNKDLLSLEEGIPIVNFAEEMQKRNKEMEFRVFLVFDFLIHFFQIIRRITETQHHNDNLEDYHPDKAKHNRYGNIIPCNSSPLIFLISE